jgi:putative ABC transport system permease protein
MSFLDALGHRLGVLLRPRAFDDEMEEEMRFHLTLEAMQRESASRGTLSTSDARLAARRRFGNTTYIKEERRRMTGLGFFDLARQDLRFALRSFRRTPGFTVGAVLTLAIGIGANTAIFSAVNAMLFRPLPFREPERLMEVGLVTPGRDGEPGSRDMVWSYLKAATFRRAQTIFEDIALYSTDGMTVRVTEAQRETGEVVDTDYLPTLGIQPVLGRNFLEEENRPPTPRAVVMISNELWTRSFNADPTVLGRTIDVDNAPFTIIGVLPPGFHGLSGRANLWATIAARRPYMFEPQEAWDHEFSMIARLKPGISAEQAAAAVVVLGARVDAAHPAPEPGRKWGASARLLDRTRVDPIIRRSLLVLLGAVGFVLLIACANLANLFLVRASSRQREIAVRLAIGAGRGRLVRQLLTESLVLSALGGLASIAVAWWGIHVLSSLNPASTFSVQRLGGIGAVNFTTVRLDLSAFAFAAAAALATGVLFGLVPALQATRPSLTAALKEGSSEERRPRAFRRLSTRNVLVVTEIALAVVLLAGSGLMLRSLSKLLGIDPGFVPEQVLTLRLNSTPGVRGRDSLPGFYQELLARLRALPGVTDAALGDCPPLSGGCNATLIRFRDRAPAASGTEPVVGVHWVTPAWLSTLRVPLKTGRPFSDADRLGGRKVVLVSESAARRFWPNESPIGKPVAVGQGGFGDTAWVVGIVGDVRFGTIDSLPAPDLYISYYQSPRPGALVYLRTSGDPASLAAAARRVIQRFASDVPVYDVRTLSARVGDATAQTRFSAFLLALFAGAALVLAGVGVYGVVSFSVAQRTREIGIRVALGAARSDVLRLVVGQGAALAMVGAIVGLVAALAATRVLRTLLFDVVPSDPTTFIVVVALLAGATIVASWIPARRAARVHPADALR